MRTESGAYRFSLQFPNQTEQQRVVGKHLEGLGSKKSSFIVNIIYEHLTRPPEGIQAIGLSRNDLKGLIREVLSERGMVIQLAGEATVAEPDGANVNAMLDFMGLMQQ